MPYVETTYNVMGLTENEMLLIYEALKVYKGEALKAADPGKLMSNFRIVVPRINEAPTSTDSSADSFNFS